MVNKHEWYEGYKDYTMGVYVTRWCLKNREYEARHYDSGWQKAREDAKNGVIPTQEHIRYIDLVEEV